MAALARMDRRELADIGLTMSDLRDVSALALDRDPTILLAARVGERRRDPCAPTALSAEILPHAWERNPAGLDRSFLRRRRRADASARRDDVPPARRPNERTG
jgi:hypothetical protein